jgi:cobalt-zinc-cadmium resistance protein CzcA
MRRLVQFALTQPLFVLLGLLLLIGSGLIAFKNLPVEAFPDVTDTQVTIITLYPGRAAEEVEKQVTIPLEVALAGIPNSVRMFSHTQFGLSYLVMTFNDKANDYFSRQQVLERLRDADLPEGVKPELGALTSAISEIYRYRLKADHLSSTEIRTLQNWIMERQLKTVPGVADVVSFGGLIKNYEIHPKLDRLRDDKISLTQLSDAIKKTNANSGGGYVEHGAQQYLIRGIGLLRNASDLENVVVAERNGTPILVKDVADVAIGAIPRQGVAGQDDNDDIVYGLVLMRKGENASVVLDLLKEKIADLNANQLPKGVSIVPFYDRSWLIGTTMHTVFSNLLEGALLVTIVLYLFLSNMRAAAIVAAVIPLALLGTFIGLSAIGVPANLLSLGAMDFGIIVDGAVIVVEHIFHELAKHGNEDIKDQRLARVLKAAVEVGRPTLFSMLIIIAAHLPILSLQRHEGRIFSPMAYSVIAALITSLILSLTLVPLACYKLLGKNLPHGDNKLLTACKLVYKKILSFALSNPKKVIISAILALAASFSVTPYLGTEFLPELNEGSLWVNVSLEPSISIKEAVDQTKRIRNAIREVPEIASVISKLGRPEDGTDPKIASQIEVLVDMWPEEQWRKGISKEDVIQQIEEKLGNIPGIAVSVSQPIRDNVLESISQIDGQIVIKVTGDDLDKLQQYGQTILSSIKPVAGVSRAFIDRNGQLPQYRIEIDSARAARYGLSIGDVDETIETALAGKDVNSIWEGERRFGVTVRLADEERELDRIRNLFVTTSNGVFVPLSEIATFELKSGAQNIARENGRRVLSIGIFIRDRDMGSVVADMQTAVEKNLKLDGGYKISWAGEFENQERAMKRLSWVVPLAIFIIFLILFDAFNSISDALIITANIPLAMIGGIFALLATGIPLSVSAAIGFIALFGQAVLNGVVMLSHFRGLMAKGLGFEDAIFEGAMDRLRTVLMTALLAMLGLFPMAVSRAVGAETQRPLAVVVIGGLITSTLLTLVVLPVVFRWVEGRKLAKA